MNRLGIESLQQQTCGRMVSHTVVSCKKRYEFHKMSAGISQEFVLLFQMLNFFKKLAEQMCEG